MPKSERARGSTPTGPRRMVVHASTREGNLTLIHAPNLRHGQLHPYRLEPATHVDPIAAATTTSTGNVYPRPPRETSRPLL